MAVPASEPKVGGEMYLYYNSGSYGTPTWVIVGDIGDVTPNDNDTEIPVPLRSNYPFMTYMRGMTDLSAEFQLLYKSGVSDTVYKAFEDAKKNRTPMDLLFLDGPVATEGSKGVRAISDVFKFTPGQPVDGAVMVDVGVKPSVNNGGNKPAYWVTPPA